MCPNQSDFVAIGAGEYTIKLDPATASGGSVCERGLPVSGVGIMIQGTGR